VFIISDKKKAQHQKIDIGLFQAIY